MTLCLIRKCQSRIMFIVLLLLILGFLLSSFLGIQPTPAIAPTPKNGSSYISNLGENLTKFELFSQNRLVSTVDSTYPQHVEPTLAISDNDTLFVGFKNAAYHNSGGLRVSFAKSEDNGKTWSHPMDMPHFLGDSNSRQSDPWMIWKDGMLYYAYLEFSISETGVLNFSQITLARTRDYGLNWGITRATYGSNFADKETFIVTDNGIVYVVYDDAGGIGGTRIKLSRSLNGGYSFQELSNISDRAHEGHVAPYIALDSQENIYVIWTWLDYNSGLGDVFLDVSVDQGENFTAEWDVNSEHNASAFQTTTDENGEFPSKITLPVIRFDSSDCLYLLWADLYEPQGSWDVYLRYSDDFGVTWSNRTRVNPETVGNQWMPDMDIDSVGRVHIAWLDESPWGSYRPFYRSVIFSGNNSDTPQFTDPLPVSNAWTSSVFTRPGDYLTIRVDSKDVPHVVWSDGRYNEMDIYYSHAITAHISNEETSSTTVGSEAPCFTLVVLLGSIFIVITMRRLKIT